MDKAWIILFIAGIMEIVWATAMDYSDGFTIWYYDVMVFVFLAISMILLEKALKGGIPVGTGYAVWTGIGAIGTIALSVAAGHETLTLLRTVLVIMIITGIAGLQVTAGGSDDGPAEGSE
ncbi:MAG: multidrug efflux SMR transporter [Candidatus Methanomethylophilaceae archaeon]|nr:multidrug efflux SMR transporter [Candidatus Methanomethylophilaceae archaeon]MBO7351536.1 multidrug efflux SMR transporter [Candidatus Methanomethylophilaceae archaeon]